MDGSHVSRMLWGFSVAAVVAFGLFTGAARADNNYKPAAILSQLDIDGDGLPDGAPDTDGDGLPDNWEVGGQESIAADGNTPDRFVNFSAPTAIGPGTPPTFVLSRLPVTTSAVNIDTDGDGLTDFIEVFGLKYIDDNGNGVLDFLYDDSNKNGRWDSGEPIHGESEWLDLNNDGLPSIGELPLANLFGSIDMNGDGTAETTVYVMDDMNGDLVPETPRVIGPDLNGDGKPDSGFNVVDDDGDGVPDRVISDQGTYTVVKRQHDFDGFVFTDPTLADTDGDGLLDGEDRDPLINPQTFGVSLAKGWGRVANDTDIDNDGLGDGMDLGNDLIQTIDSPTSFATLVDQIRPDRYKQEDGTTACAHPTVPESIMEDLIGADWNGDGLYRITDIRGFHRNVTTAYLQGKYKGRYEELFKVGDRELFGSNPATSSPDPCSAVTPPESCYQICVNAQTPYGERIWGLPIQEILLPSGRQNPFLPDVRVWTILYAWRVPGWDVDGNGYVGSPQNNYATDEVRDFKTSTSSSGTGTNLLFDGKIQSPCGTIGGASATAMVFGLALMVFVPRRRRRRHRHR